MEEAADLGALVDSGQEGCPWKESEDVSRVLEEKESRMGVIEPESESLLSPAQPTQQPSRASTLESLPRRALGTRYGAIASSYD
jgi:hypothetical protein